MKTYDKKLHDRLRHRTGLYCYNDHIGVDSDDIDCLLDEIERLQESERWIPVSERLPEEKDCPVDSNGKIIPFVVGCINGTLYGLIHLDHFVDNKHYTHWQSIHPLPPSPEVTQ